MINTMTKVTLTPDELSEVIDKAFSLGKVYATDELQSAGLNTPPVSPRDQESWNHWIELNHGNALNSGEAKMDILYEACKEAFREELRKVTAY